MVIICKMNDDLLILLCDCVDWVDYLFRLVVDLDLDGVVIDVVLFGGSRVVSVLFRIGFVV